MMFLEPSHSLRFQQPLPRRNPANSSHAQSTTSSALNGSYENLLSQNQSTPIQNQYLEVQTGYDNNHRHNFQQFIFLRNENLAVFQPSKVSKANIVSFEINSKVNHLTSQKPPIQSRLHIYAVTMKTTAKIDLSLIPVFFLCYFFITDTLCLLLRLCLLLCLSGQTPTYDKVIFSKVFKNRKL